MLGIGQVCAGAACVAAACVVCVLSAVYAGLALWFGWCSALRWGGAYASVVWLSRIYMCVYMRRKRRLCTSFTTQKRACPPMQHTNSIFF
jgi:hypothetical protein